MISETGSRVWLNTDQLIKTVAKSDIKADDFAKLIGVDPNRIPDIVSGEIVDTYFMEKWEAYQNLKTSILSFDKNVLSEIIKYSFTVQGGY